MELEGYSWPACSKQPWLVDWGIASHVFVHCLALFYVCKPYSDNYEYTAVSTHTCLTALFPGLPGWAGTRRTKPIWDPIHYWAYDSFLAHASRKTSVRHARLFTMHIVRATAVRGRKFRRKSTTSTEMSYDLLSYAYIWKTFLFLPFLSFLVGYTEVTSFYTSPQHIKRYVT